MKSRVCVGCLHWLPIQSFLGPALPWEVLWLYDTDAWLLCGDPSLAVGRAEGANFSRFAYVVGAFPQLDSFITLFFTSKAPVQAARLDLSLRSLPHSFPLHHSTVESTLK